MKYKSKDIIDGAYSVVFPIKMGAYAETYRVKDAQGKRYFLKLIDTSLLKDSQRDSNGNIREITILESLDHPNLPKFVSKGTMTVNGKEYAYVVNDFVSSETLAERLQRASTLSVYDTKQIVLGVLEALKYLHTRENPVIHNEVTALNVLVDLSSHNLRDVRLIDFGNAHYIDECFGIETDGQNWFCMAPELIEGCATEQSDLYSVGALMYQLLFGMLPWFCDLSNVSPDKRKEFVMNQKSSNLLLPNTNVFDLDDKLLNIMSKALAFEVEDRFQTAGEFIDAINGKIDVEPSKTLGNSAMKGRDAYFNNGDNHGNGFADVAGMNDLKQMLLKSVINILKDTEKARRYKLKIPNGILFYGPPGCGKSFLAEKFAEEAGYNFKLVKASDLASIYVHGSQEKIGTLFDEARKHAPTILCFDEFDALVPARGKVGNEHQAGEVNEFLTQLNNCGEKGVFVIASTNRPDMIDAAVLRRGRIDKIIYVPEPDEEARKAMFELHMKGRPFDSNVDFIHLAKITEGYVASDIAFVVNEAATRAAFSDVKISLDILEEVISECRPSMTPDAIQGYKKMREKMEGIIRERNSIGFKFDNDDK